MEIIALVLVGIGILLVIIEGVFVFRKALLMPSKTQSLMRDYRAYVREQRIAPYEEFLESRQSGSTLIIVDAISLNDLQKEWDLAYSQS